MREASFPVANRTRIARFGFSIAACLMLTGCSYSYDIDAVMNGDVVTFTKSGGPGFGAPDVEVCQFYVFDQAEQIPEPPGRWPPRAMKDDPSTMWGFSVHRPETGQGCAPFPVRYGRVPAGAIETVALKPLVRGKPYYVWADAPGISGDGTFRIVDSIRNTD